MCRGASPSTCTSHILTAFYRCCRPSAAAARGRPNFGFCFGFGAECEQMGTFGGHLVSAEGSRTTFGALSVSACCS